MNIYGIVFSAPWERRRGRETLYLQGKVRQTMRRPPKKTHGTRGNRYGTSTDCTREITVRTRFASIDALGKTYNKKKKCCTYIYVYAGTYWTCSQVIYPCKKKKERQEKDEMDGTDLFCSLFVFHFVILSQVSYREFWKMHNSTSTISMTLLLTFLDVARDKNSWTETRTHQKQTT